MAKLAHLDPPSVWKHFEAICGIPHPSGHEEQIAAYLMGEAERLGLTAKRDAIGNVLVTQPATPGHEAAPTVILQGHMDMVGVCVDGLGHDFTRDPLDIYVDGDYVRARGTTLGADNGIGVAFMLAVMESTDLVHPKLEHLFTISEETGMDGAYGLTADFVEGRRLINLDTEEFGEIYISCAGGGDSIISLDVERASSDQGAATLSLVVGGLKGGHSGADIHLGRGSANKLLARALAHVDAASPIRLRAISGGNQRNSIADNARALFDVAAAGKAAALAAIAEFAAVARAELSSVDPGIEIVGADGAPNGMEPMTAASSATTILMLLALPHGILAMSPDMAGLVETSTNMGTLETSKESVTTVLLTRSAIDSSQVMAQQHVRAIATLAGARVEEPRGYPGWRPNPASDLLRVAKMVYHKLYGKQAEIKAIHAGLECGLFGDKLPGVDMVSIGPTMANVHSPDEELFIPHVTEFNKLLRAYIEALA